MLKDKSFQSWNPGNLNNSETACKVLDIGQADLIRVGLNTTRWVLATDLLVGKAEVETLTVLIIGGGLVGLETADILSDRGKQVTVIEILDQVGGGMNSLAKAMIVKRLQQKNVMIHTSTKISQLTPGMVIVRKNGQVMVFTIETVVISVGISPNSELSDSLEDNYSVH